MRTDCDSESVLSIWCVQSGVSIVSKVSTGKLDRFIPVIFLGGKVLITGICSWPDMDLVKRRTKINEMKESDSEGMFGKGIYKF